MVRGDLRHIKEPDWVIQHEVARRKEEFDRQEREIVERLEEVRRKEAERKQQAAGRARKRLVRNSTPPA
jgi:hypothetical protein